MNKQIWFHIIIYFYCFCYICPFHNYKSEDSFSLINQTVQTLFMDYENDYILNLINENKNERTVVIHSINCKIAFKDIKPNSSNIILDQKNNDTFSLKIEKNNSEGFLGKIITLKHIKSNEQFEHYKYKECPIMFTNIYHNNETSLFLNDTSTLYFYNNLKEVNLSYYINDLNNDNPIALSLTFDIKSNFEIKVVTNKETIITKNISNSTNIFFTKEFKQGENIIINIKHLNETPSFMNAKIIKNTSISFLEHNNLNYGFITSNIEYQYYYMQVSKGEEGELMLHNKRQKGINYCKISEQK